MRKIRQLDLFSRKPKRGRKPLKPRDHFGGVHLKTYNPKSARPMDSKKALHLVLRSSRATGVRSFKSKAYEAKIWAIVSRHASRTGVRIYEYANGGNHLHLLIRAKHRDDYNAFIRVVTGLIARLVGGSERGRPLGTNERGQLLGASERGRWLKAKFWDARPFTRIVSFAKREFQAVKSYLLRNTLEAIGWMPYIPRDRRLPPAIRRQFLPIVV